MLIDERVSRLIHEIYDASLAPDAWPHALRSLANLTKARMTSLIAHPAAGKDFVLANFGLDPAFAASYERHYYRHNIYLHKGRPMLREGAVLPHEAYCTDQEILHSEYYNDFQRHLGLFRVVAGGISSGPNGHTVVSVNRSRNQPPFTRDELRLIAALLPHIRRALQIGARMEHPAKGERPGPAPEVLALTLGLTRAEAHFASLLASGLPVQQICAQLQIRVSTARTHLRHLYQKTNTGRQAELVAHLLAK
jgi:DNA-binding CsgD family transcriptional regulator